MARQVRDSRLETREARLAKAPRRDEPYRRLIDEGLHLRYRKRARGGVVDCPHIQKRQVLQAHHRPADDNYK